MVGFNFLPDRELLLAKVVKKWQRIIGGVFLFTVIVCVSLHQYLTSQLIEASMQEAALQAEIDALLVLEKDVHGNNERWQVLEKYQLDAREYLTHTAKVLSVLANQSQKTVCFTNLQRHKQELMVQGYALSAEDLLAQLKRWRRSGEFVAIDVASMKWLVRDNVLEFEVKVSEGRVFS